MGIFSKFKDMVVGEYDDDEEREMEEDVVEIGEESGRRMSQRDYEPDYQPEQAAPKPFGVIRKRATIKNNGQLQVFIASPDDYDKSQEISDYLKARRPVVVNLEKVEYPVAQRIMDFLSGTIYALEGSIQRVTNNIFVLAPDNIEISGDLLSEMKSGGIEMTSWDYERRASR
ncbi:MAG: cell division protein SepF [Firmicutes bacterium]|nr:cell division protein SepF [Bacillota bacterium]